MVARITLVRGRKVQGLIGPWLNEEGSDHFGPRRGALCLIEQDAYGSALNHLLRGDGKKRWLGPPWSEEESARSDRTLTEGVKEGGLNHLKPKKTTIVSDRTQ